MSRWFSSRGFTPLMEGTTLTRRSAGERLAVALAVVLVVFAVIPLAQVWSGGVTPGDLVMAVGTVVLMLVFWVARNLTTRRPPFAPLRQAAWPERAAFVLIPALISLVAPVSMEDMADVELGEVGVRVYSAGAEVIGQLLMLWIVTIVVNSGAYSLGAWLRRQVASSFVAAGGALGRTLPLLLGVVGLVFFTNEIWQTLGLLTGWGYLLPLLLFAVVSWAFLSSRAHMDLSALGQFTSAADVEAVLADTPLAGPVHLPMPARTPLTREQENNLRLVSVVSRLTVATVIGGAIFLFFVAFGVLVANAATVQSWADAAPRVLFGMEIGDRTYDLTIQHLRVAGFLGVFAGFYYAVVSATDEGLKAGLNDTAEDAIREACAARLVALERFPGPDGPNPNARSGRSRGPVVWVFTDAPGVRAAGGEVAGEPGADTAPSSAATVAGPPAGEPGEPPVAPGGAEPQSPTADEDGASSAGVAPVVEDRPDA